MDDLVAFLAARLDGEEKYAHKIQEQIDGRSAYWDQRGVSDPARMRREIAADRALLRAFGDACAFHQPYPDSFDAGYRDGLEVAVKLRAAVYSGHPDYNPDWKPLDWRHGAT